MANRKITFRPENHLLSLAIDWMINDDINHARTPFEVEWHCLRLEQANVVDGVTSKDGDCVVLGAKKVRFNVNFNNESFQVFNMDNDNNSEINPLLTRDADKWHLIGVVLGCDYLPRTCYLDYST